MKVRLNLVGLDGNIYSLLGAFESAGRKQKVDPSFIKDVREKVLSSNSYDEALCVLIDNTETEEEED